jgi:hypothetical protein
MKRSTDLPTSFFVSVAVTDRRKKRFPSRTVGKMKSDIPVNLLPYTAP